MINRIVFALLIFVSAAIHAENTITMSDILGAWKGEALHNGQSTELAFEFEERGKDSISVLITVPALHLSRYPLGSDAFRTNGDTVSVPLFDFVFDKSTGTLSSILPKDLVPVYRIPFTIRRTEKIESLSAAVINAPIKQPLWIFNSGTKFMGGAVYANGVVYAGNDSGYFYAIDGKTGSKIWSIRMNGAIRTRAAVSDDAVYLYADDGFVYKIKRSSGKELWRVKADSSAIVRLPPGDPKTLFDRFGADPLLHNDRLYIGAHDGRLMVLDASTGSVLWEYTTGGAILAAPLLSNGTIYCGSYDGYLYAVDEAADRLKWKFDTKEPVVSTPAIDGGILVIGSRSYDLFGVDAKSGASVWKYYFWFSWIESSATIRDGAAYVGSSDALGLYAFSVATGRPLWKLDVPGWAWGQPAVTDKCVYMGITGSARPNSIQRGGVVAVDRLSGEPVWQFVSTAPQSGQYGFAASSALGETYVYFTGMDGSIYAFEQ